MEPDTIVCGKYRIHDKIGAGTFGQVYQATELETLKTVALKVEFVSAKTPQLYGEAMTLKTLQGGEGIPKFYWQGAEQEFNVLAMQLLGPSLESLMRRFHRNLSLPTVVQVAKQLLKRVEFIHSKDILHRDIKSDNFCIGLGRKSDTIYAIDFGLSKKFRDTRTNQHITYRETNFLTGTSRFASINSHMGLELSRRDDLESLAYLLTYLAKGKLPWQRVHSRSKAEKRRKVFEIKSRLKPNEICEELPLAFTLLMKYSRSLRFEQEPNYKYCNAMFSELTSDSSLCFRRQFEWSPQVKSRSLRVKITPRQRIKCKSHGVEDKIKTDSSEATEIGFNPKPIDRSKFARLRFVKFNLTPEVITEETKCTIS